jgi:hypothetical protein
VLRGLASELKSLKRMEDAELEHPAEIDRFVRDAPASAPGRLRIVRSYDLVEEATGTKIPTLVVDESDFARHERALEFLSRRGVYVGVEHE